MTPVEILFRCESCGDVSVTLQVPSGTTTRDLARDLDAVRLESEVGHEIAVHLDQVTA
jgi:hypothetical protein